MLFPSASFRVLLPHGAIWTGKRVDGTLEIDAPEDIPRAERIDLSYVVRAWAGYGAGKNRTVVRYSLFQAPLTVPLDAHVLAKGTHRFPFAIDVPAWVPPEYRGDDCAIEHRVETRLDVDWALDPKATHAPPIVMAPQEAMRAPLNFRTPPWFHDSIVLEVTLASGVISQEEELRGQIAMRAGHGARFDAVELTLVDVATIHMGRRERRRGAGLKARLPADDLRTGEPLSFVFPAGNRICPTFRNPAIDNDVVLVLTVDIPWATDPTIEIPLQVLPAGSRLHGDASYALVGGARLRASAAAMARQTGLSEGSAPVLVEGRVGPVLVRLLDVPREGKIGFDVELSFPDVGLGTSFHPLGILDGFRTSPLLPKALGDKYLLRTKPTTDVDDEALTTFYGRVVAGLEGAADMRLTDRHVGAHFELGDDDGARMTAIAAFAKQKATQIADAISGLPFPEPFAPSRATWEAVAREQGAFVVPTGPSLHGLTFGAQLFDGSERTIDATIHTARGESGPITRVEIDLRSATVPDEAARALASGEGSELARTIAHTFPRAEVHGATAMLEKPGFTADPRELFGALESFLSWLVEARGERRGTAPYR